MQYYAAIDVSLELSSVCMVDGTGKIVRETKVASEPEELATLLNDTGLGSLGSVCKRARCRSGCMPG